MFTQLKSMVLFELHASPTTGKSGFTKTYERVKCSFLWEVMKQYVHTFMEECDVCQCNKGEFVKVINMIEPLPIQPAICRDISIDFVVVLPKSSNKLDSMVVVDCISSHLCDLQHPFTKETMAQLFMDNIFKLHGMPHSIFSDKDPTFTSNFSQELFRLQRTQLQLITTYQSQTHGQIEVFKKCLETYLWCFL
jgi:hypothetical protein